MAGSAGRCQGRDYLHLCQPAVAGQGCERYHPLVEEAHRQLLSCLRLRIDPCFLLEEGDPYLATSPILSCLPEGRHEVEFVPLSGVHYDSA